MKWGHYILNIKIIVNKTLAMLLFWLKHIAFCLLSSIACHLWVLNSVCFCLFKVIFINCRMHLRVLEYCLPKRQWSKSIMENVVIGFLIEDVSFNFLLCAWHLLKWKSNPLVLLVFLFIWLPRMVGMVSLARDMHGQRLIATILLENQGELPAKSAITFMSG